MNKQEEIEKLIKEEKRLYLNNWRKNNKDRVKKHNADYWKRRAEKRLNNK